MLAEASNGMSPVDLGLATMDWLSHLALSPGTRLRLAQSLLEKSRRLGVFSVQSLFNKSAEGPASAIERRMSSDPWNRWPFNVLAQGHQLSKDWWREATTGIEGVSGEHEVIVNSVANQILDMVSPVA